MRRNQFSLVVVEKYSVILVIYIRFGACIALSLSEFLVDQNFRILLQEDSMLRNNSFTVLLLIVSLVTANIYASSGGSASGYSKAGKYLSLEKRFKAKSEEIAKGLFANPKQSFDVYQEFVDDYVKELLEHGDGFFKTALADNERSFGAMLLAEEAYSKVLKLEKSEFNARIGCEITEESLQKLGFITWDICAQYIDALDCEKTHEDLGCIILYGMGYHYFIPIGLSMDLWFTFKLIWKKTNNFKVKRRLRKEGVNLKLEDTGKVFTKELQVSAVAIQHAKLRLKEILKLKDSWRPLHVN